MPSVNVTTSAALLVPANAARNAVAIQNISDTDIFVGGPAVTTTSGANAGLRVPAAGGLLTISRSFPGDRSVDGALFAIHAGTGTKEIRYLEL